MLFATYFKMPFRFTWICDLLQAIEDIECRDPPHLPDRKRTLLRTTIERWFRQHRKNIDQAETDGAALLSTLFPQARTDRVYSIKAPRLEKLVARCLNYRTEKVRELGAWKLPGRGDLGACLERIEKIHDSEPLPRGDVLTVEEVDRGLHDIASQVRFSSPAVQKHVSADLPQQILTHILLRIHSRDKKWFIRLFLKDYGRVVLDEQLVLGEFHFLLPPLLKFQNDFTAAMMLLREPLARYHAKPDPLSQKLMLEQAALHLKPKVDVKIGRPTWYKARSMQNCLQMVGDATWVIERKYDGEFCEIHVDLTKEDRIQIFSKNGKDATRDRKDLLPAIKESLRIDTAECQFNSKCILLGEMVVFNQVENKVMDFDKIRKHVSRSGSFLGTDKDSQPHPYENLMIFYFDILLVDDEITMTLPHSRRRKRLSEIITKIDGRAKTVEWKPLDFSEPAARKSMFHQFCAALLDRCEGLILKPNGPFFPLARDETGSWCRGFIKLKKDYMTDMGGSKDQADFAIVAASYDVHEAQKCRQRNLKWTNFYLGCLVDDDYSYQARPRFRIVAIIKATHCIPAKELDYLNQVGQFHCRDFDNDEAIEHFAIQFGKNPLPSVVFIEPLVVEVLGSGFEKPPNEDFHMLRHPRILKTHTDRSWEDCVTMQGLAQMAREAREAPSDGESEDIRQKVQYCMAKISRSRERNSLSSRQTATTPRSGGSYTTPLATLKSVGRTYSPGTPSPATVFKQSQGLQPSASSTASVKTPSPATAFMKANHTTLHPVTAIDFAEEATPVSQQSTQWTETIVTSPVSAKHIVRQPLPSISPPRRRLAVPDKVSNEVPSLGSRTRSQTYADIRKSPSQDSKNTTRPRQLQPHLLRRPVEELPAKVLTERCDCNKDIIVDEDMPEQVSFYEEREARSLHQQISGLRKQHMKENVFDGHKHKPSQGDPQPHEYSHSVHSSSVFARPRSTALLKGAMVHVSPQQRKDAENIIARQRALKMTFSTESTIEPEEFLSRPRSADASAFMLPPTFLPTPPKSSPKEPTHGEKTLAIASSRLPASPPSSSPLHTPTVITRSKENIPLQPKPRAIDKGAATGSHILTASPGRGLKRPATGSVDDFAIDAIPRKIPKWFSAVYGRPHLPPLISTNKENSDSSGSRTITTPVSANRYQSSTSGYTSALTTITVQPPAPFPLLPIPYNLTQTVIYLAPSLQLLGHPLRQTLTKHFTHHAPLVIDDIEHWRRGDVDDDGVPKRYDTQGSTVGESQAYSGYDKVVLVEPARRKECTETKRMVEGVIGASGGTEVVGMFDWRVFGGSGGGRRRDERRLR